MKFEVSLNDADTKLLENHLKKLDVSLPEFTRRALLEAVFDDDYCLALYEKAAKEYEKDPVTYPFEEVVQRLTDDEKVKS